MIAVPQAVARIDKSLGFLYLFSLVIVCQDFEEAFSSGPEAEAQNTLNALDASLQAFMSHTAEEVTFEQSVSSICFERTP